MKFLDVLAQMGCTVTEKADGIEVTGPAEDTLKGIRDRYERFFRSGIDSCCNGTVLQIRCAYHPHRTYPWTGMRPPPCHVRGTDQTRNHMYRRTGCHHNKTRNPVRWHCVNYEDHRVAMSFALLGLKVDGIVIDNPSCCRKTFENYFDLLDQLSGKDR